MHLRPVLGASLIAVLATAPIATQQNPFAKALPESTLAYVSVPDIRTSIAEFQQMPLGKMWGEQQVQDFFTQALEKAAGHWEQGLEQARAMHAEGQLPFDPDELIKMRLGAISMALTSMELQVSPDGDPLPKVGLVLHADFGDSAPIWRQVIETGLQMLEAQAGGELARSATEVEGVTIHTFRPANEPQVEMGLNIAFVGGGVLLGTLQDDVSGMVSRLATGTAGLSASAAYAGGVQNVKFDGAEAEVFVQVGLTLEKAVAMFETAATLEPELQQVDVDGVRRALQAIGLAGLDSVAMASRYEQGRAVSETFVAVPEAERQGLMKLSSGALDMGFLRWVPKDAASFQATKLDFKGVWSTIVDTFRAYDPELAEGMLGQLAEMEQQLGMSIERDLFGAFGDEFVTWSMPVAAVMAAPEMIIVAKVENQAGLMKTLETVASMSNGAMELKERRGEFWQIRFKVDAEQMGGYNPFDTYVPTFGFKDGYMVMGFATNDIKRAYKRMDREDDPSDDIRSNAEFARCLEELPESGVASLSFTDWKSTFESYYQIAGGFVFLLPQDESIPFDWALLPDATTLSQHLFGTVSWSEWNADGAKSTSISPFGPEVPLALTVLIGAGAVTWMRVSQGGGLPFEIR